MGTVTKALKLLDLFSLARPEIGLSDCARLAGLNKATTHRLLSELEAQGFVEQSGPARLYRIGPAVLRLAAVREATHPMREAALPVLRRLADATGETAHAAVLQGDRLAMLAYAYSARHGTRVAMEDADFLPLHATASGLAALAWRAPAEAAAALGGALARFTEHTETSSERLRARLIEVRRSGLAESVGGFEMDVHGFAVPLFDAQSACAGTLAVAAPVTRVTPELARAIRQELQLAGEELTSLWGGRVPSDAAETRHAG